MDNSLSDQIYVVEWIDDESNHWSISTKSEFATHLYKKASTDDDNSVYCKHCGRKLNAHDDAAIALHMNRIHPQIKPEMTYNQYLQRFRPVYAPNAHGPEKAMERSFTVDLRKYVLCPEELPGVLYYDDVATIIHDKFPKSEQHLLVLPRSHQASNGHPTTLNERMKRKLRWHLDWAEDYCHSQFIKRYQILEPKMNKESFISTFIQCGVHSVPSMANCHIHVMTKDFHSSRLKNKKHFNSFNTQFFVPFDKLPLFDLPSEDELVQMYIKKHDLISPYTSTSFGNHFTKLKAHLEAEFCVRFQQRADYN